MVKIHFLQKVLKNGLVSEINFFIFSIIWGERGVRTLYGIFHNFFLFFFEPFPNLVFNLVSHISVPVEMMTWEDLNHQETSEIPLKGKILELNRKNCNLSLFQKLFTRDVKEGC